MFVHFFFITSSQYFALLTYSNSVYKKHLHITLPIFFTMNVALHHLSRKDNKLKCVCVYSSKQKSLNSADQRGIGLCKIFTKNVVLSSINGRHNTNKMCCLIKFIPFSAQLLFPHFRTTLYINTVGRIDLFGPGGALSMVRLCKIHISEHNA